MSTGTSFNTIISSWTTTTQAGAGSLVGEPTSFSPQGAPQCLCVFTDASTSNSIKFMEVIIWDAPVAPEPDVSQRFVHS